MAVRLLIAVWVSCCDGTFFDVTFEFCTILIFVETLVCLTVKELLVGGGLLAATTAVFDANWPDE